MIDGRAIRITFMTRLYRLLADRPEYLTGNRAEVIERLLAAQVTVSEFDRTLILHSGELDRLCAYAVRALMRHAPRAVLDVLGVLDPDRIVAMFYALPDSRRGRVRRDPVWGYHINQAPEDLPEAIAEVERLVQFNQEASDTLARLCAVAPREAREQTESLERLLLRGEAGLPTQEAAIKEARA